MPVTPAPRLARVGDGEDGAGDADQVIGAGTLQGGGERIGHAGNDGGPVPQVSHGLRQGLGRGGPRMARTRDENPVRQRQQFA